MILNNLDLALVKYGSVYRFVFFKLLYFEYSPEIDGDGYIYRKVKFEWMLRAVRQRKFE